MNQTEASKQVLQNSQQEHFPYEMEIYGMQIEVHKNVFSPKYFNGWKLFTDNFPDVTDKRVVEIGTATGVTALYLAQHGAAFVLGLDINEAAVENARKNIEKNNVSNIEVRYSDIFSGLHEGEKFDIIYWNMPFMPAADNYEYESVLERGLFDPGYRITERFLKEALGYLTENGMVLLGTGEGEFADIPKLLALCEKYNYDAKLIMREASTEINPVYFRLYEIKKK